MLCMGYIPSEEATAAALTGGRFTAYGDARHRDAEGDGEHEKLYTEDVD